MSNGPVLTLPGGAFMLSYALTQQGTNVLTCITSVSSLSLQRFVVFLWDL